MSGAACASIAPPRALTHRRALGNFKRDALYAERTAVAVPCEYEVRLARTELRLDSSLAVPGSREAVASERRVPEANLVVSRRAAPKA